MVEEMKTQKHWF